MLSRIAANKTRQLGIPMELGAETYAARTRAGFYGERRRARMRLGEADEVVLLNTTG
jgi:hypothetical protein